VRARTRSRREGGAHALAVEAAAVGHLKDADERARAQTFRDALSRVVPSTRIPVARVPFSVYRTWENWEETFHGPSRARTLEGARACRSSLTLTASNNGRKGRVIEDDDQFKDPAPASTLQPKFLSMKLRRIAAAVLAQ
jgi:hypothetical protein